MAVDHVKATEITNRDTAPRTVGTAGRGSPAPLQYTEGYATAVASSSADATYQLVRVPTTAIIKEIFFESEAQGAGKFDLGVYYASDLSNPLGTSPPLAAGAVDQDFFATVIDCASAVVRTNVTNESTTYSLDKRTMPLWQAAGLSADPGGNFDIVATVKTTAVTTGTGKFGIGVFFAN